jgi:uncharacterized YigZ family protein
VERPFNTLHGTGDSALEIKRSRFLGRAAPLSSVQAFQDLLAGVRAAHPEAGHHAFAYRLGISGEAARFSDDGEPGGTAGRPIMEMLLREQIVDAAVIVTRYWGGILLGSGGLTRAYGQAATEAVRGAGLTRMTPHTSVSITIEYAQYGGVEQMLLHAGLRAGETVFSDVVTLVVFVPAGAEEAFKATIGDLTAGSALLDTGATVYLAG